MQSTHHIKNASIIEYIDGHHAGFHFIGYRECKLLFKVYYLAVDCGIISGSECI